MKSAMFIDLLIGLTKEDIMTDLNNLDVIILIIIGISALIALSRGLVKEVLSIIGWILSTIAVVYLLPVLNPFVSEYVASGLVAGVVTSLFIVIVFLVFWILTTGQLVDKIRSSKLSNMDRTLGLFFGIARACLLVILFNILVGWMIPKDQQSEVLTQSKYFKIAGNFAEPIEKLIPEATLETIRKKASEAGESEKAKKEKSETDELFEKLAQPKIKKKTDLFKKTDKEEPAKTSEGSKLKIKESVETEGYNIKQRESLDSLIDAVH